MLKRLNRSFLKGALIATGAFAILSMSAPKASASTFPVFTIDPTIFGTYAPSGTCVAPCTTQQSDRISGTYYENLTITGATTWTSTGFVLFQVVQDANDAGLTSLQSGLTFTYGLFATYSASGTFSTSGSNVNFQVGAATGNLYVNDFTGAAGLTPTSGVDTFDTNASGGYTLPTLSAFDFLLAQGIFFNGSGVAASTPPPTGSYTINYMPTELTNTSGLNSGSCSADGISAGAGPGCSYFISPNPFYILANLSGQFANITSLTPGVPQTLTGTADLYFAGTPIPEPATLSLFGLGLVGLSRVRRSRKKNA